MSIRCARTVVDPAVRLLVLALSLAVLACSSRAVAPAGDPPPTPGDAPAGVAPGGEAVRVELAGERIGRLAPAGAAPAAWLWPAIVDSHVHLTYWSVAERLPATGLAAAVDLAAPAVRGDARLHVISSGPMLTRPGGYPLDSWGADGYGIGCADAACVTAAIDRLAGQGAGVIKLALDDGGLDPALIPAAVAAAHARRLRVAAHALSDRSARLAAAGGVDLLAHAPVEPLAPETAAAWRGRAVISTLAAFGGGPAAVANLRALRAAGAIVLYGTDLGNLRDAGPSAAELALLRAAGLDEAAITDAMTTAPARYWNLPFGAIAPGAEASLLVLDRDPRADASALLSPRAVWLRGRRVR
jgi:imidazolonepropionase-like amidohydrolase